MDLFIKTDGRGDGRTDGRPAAGDATGVDCSVLLFCLFWIGRSLVLSFVDGRRRRRVKWKTDPVKE